MEKNSFDLLTNLPLIFFAILFFIDFIMFIIGGIQYFLAKGDPLKLEKSLKLLTKAFKYLIYALAVFLVFMIISSLLRRGEALLPQESSSADLPAANHIGSLPPANESVKFGDYYFNGPYIFKDNFAVSRNALVAIMCKNGDKYDLIYVGETIKGKLTQNRNYSCWTSKCKTENMYLAVFWTPTEKYSAENKAAMVNSIREQVSTSCVDQD